MCADSWPTAQMPNSKQREDTANCCQDSYDKAHNRRKQDLHINVQEAIKLEKHRQETQHIYMVGWAKTGELWREDQPSSPQEY